MSADHTIRVAFKGMIGKFSLDAAFTAPAAGVTALFGPSACGKTTVLRCIAGLLHFDGVCDVDGDLWQDQDGTFLPTHKRPLGYVFQEASLFPHLSVRGNLMFGAPHDRRREAQRSRSTKSSNCIGVASLLQRSPRDLSGGERQRVAIGRALLSQPMLLLMDEPLSALDRAARDEIMPFLERLRDRQLMPIVYISHDIAEVERLADQIVLMDKGRALAAGPLADLQSDPSLPLASAREAAVTLEGTVEAHDPRYGLLTLGVRGGRFLVPAPPASIGEHRRLRIVARDVESCARAAGLKLHSQQSAWTGRLGKAHRFERNARRRGAGRGRIGGPPSLAPDTKIMGTARARRGHECLCSGEGRRAGSAARRSC